MEVVTLTEEHLGNLTSLVNWHMQTVPPGWQLAPSEVRTILAHPGWDLHYPSGLNMPRTIVARGVVEDGRVRAAIQWQPIDTPAEQGAPELAVSWVVAEPDAEPALRLLLDELWAGAAALGLPAVHLSSRFAFGVGWFGISTTWTHIINVLEQLGFEVEDRWLIMSADTTVWNPAPTKNDDQLRLTWEINEVRLEWNLKLYRHTLLVGECEVWGSPPQLATVPGADAWAVLELIEVGPEYQRQGFGRILLQEQVRFQAQRGKTKFLLYTEANNTATRQFFTAAGFSTGPECWRFKQTL